MTEKFKKLTNPKTDNYYRLKEYVLENDINWRYQEYSTPPNEEADNVIRQYNNGKICEFIDDKYQNVSYFSHVVIQRPKEVEYTNENICQFIGADPGIIPKIRSNSFELYVEPFLIDLIISNCKNKLLEYRCPLRINFNMTFPQGGSKPSIPHVDHNFPHKNMLIYFTDTGGDTIIGGDNFTPKEDDIIVFNSDWLHCHKPPENGRRVVMVMTFM